MEKERIKMDNKEAELMEAANMLQEKSREIEETYNVNNWLLSVSKAMKVNSLVTFVCDYVAQTAQFTSG